MKDLKNESFTMQQKSIQRNLKKVIDRYHLLNPVIALTITDFELFPEQKELISHYKLLEKKHLIEYSDDIELIFIELPKFTKTEKELNSIQDKWLYFIKNAGSLEYVPKNLSKEIEKAYQIANEANFSEDELDLQNKKREWVYIQKSSIELALKTGKAEGKVEGIAKGKNEATNQMVLNMVKKKISIQIISDITGLTKADIQSIVDNDDK
jgi:predicted transposase/invertase (TIGR01784 family)